MAACIDIYCDGAVTGNGKPGAIGGWAAVLLWPWTKAPGLTAVLEIGGVELETTNNRMEMRGPLAGLARVRTPGVGIRVFSDSQYVVKGMSEWIDGWIRRGELATKPNADIWQEFLAAREKHRVEWCWVRGHNGDFWNERADKIATDMVKRARKEGHGVTHESRYLRDPATAQTFEWKARQPARA